MCPVLFRDCLESWSEIHGISEDCIAKAIFRSDISDHHFSWTDSYTEIYRFKWLGFEPLIESWKCLSHINCRLASASRMIFLDQWRSEESHHRISYILIESSSLRDEYPRHSREIIRHEHEEFFDGSFLWYRSEPCNIWKKHRKFTRFSSEFDRVCIIRDLLHELRIKIVSKCSYDHTSLTIYDEETVDKCDRKSKYTSRKEHRKDLYYYCISKVEISAYPKDQKSNEKCDEYTYLFRWEKIYDTHRH